MEKEYRLDKKGSVWRGDKLVWANPCNGCTYPDAVKEQDLVIESLKSERDVLL